MDERAMEDTSDYLTAVRNRAWDAVNMAWANYEKATIRREASAVEETEAHQAYYKAWANYEKLSKLMEG